MRHKLAILAIVGILSLTAATSALASAYLVNARTVNANGRVVGKVSVQYWLYNAQFQVIHSGSALSDASGIFTYLGDHTGVVRVELKAGTGPTYARTPDANGVCNFGDIVIVPCRDCPNIEDGSGP